jgi:hypothetical protein
MRGDRSCADRPSLNEVAYPLGARSGAADAEKPLRRGGTGVFLLHRSNNVMSAWLTWLFH